MYNNGAQAHAIAEWQSDKISYELSERALTLIDDVASRGEFEVTILVPESAYIGKKAAQLLRVKGYKVKVRTLAGDTFPSLIIRW